MKETKDRVLIIDTGGKKERKKRGASEFKFEPVN